MLPRFLGDVGVGYAEKAHDLCDEAQRPVIAPSLPLLRSSHRHCKSETPRL